MLKHLAISHFAIVEQLDVECQSGMTVITGETGAGKSIMLDALGLCLGDRADKSIVQAGAKRAEISAEFDISAIPSALEWLNERDLDQDGSCILRRSITAEGRSRAFINGSPCTLADCAALGTLLVDIYSQHAHQSLLRRSVQRQLLDAYANATELAESVAALAGEWRSLTDRHQSLAERTEADSARYDLLSYQVAELEEAALVQREVPILEAELKTLSNAHFMIESASRIEAICEQQSEALNSVRSDIDDDRHPEQAVANIRELLTSVEIQLTEARHELHDYAQRVEVDPQRLAIVESRLNLIYDLARKHRVRPEMLLAHGEDLRASLSAMDNSDATLEQLQTQINDCLSRWQVAARALSVRRAEAAKTLAAKTMALLAELAMDRCQLFIDLSSTGSGAPQAQGAESVEFRISTNPGTLPGPLGKVASGGELSRISLALQVAAAEVATRPTMIFDEVDVGIGGGTAEVVGNLLNRLAERVQVMCVTHQPQVAAQGTHHLRAHKEGNESRVSTELETLDEPARVDEIARMLGGLQVTDNTLRHAREMLCLAAES